MYDFLISLLEKTWPIRNLSECYPTANNQLYVTYMDLNCKKKQIYMFNVQFLFLVYCWVRSYATFYTRDSACQQIVNKLLMLAGTYPYT